MTSLLEVMDARIAKLTEEADNTPTVSEYNRYTRVIHELEQVRQKVLEIAQKLEVEGEDATFYQDSEIHEMVTVKKALELIGQPKQIEVNPK